jgi:hypothetical protein
MEAPVGNEVVGLDVVVELDNLRKQFAAIPKVADEETKALTAAVNKNITKLEREITKAGKASRATKADLDKLAGSTKRVADTAEDAYDETKRLGEISSSAGQNLGKLAGAADLVVPGLGELVRAGADFADVGEVASETAKGLGVSLRSIITVAGPVVLAIGLIAAAWSSYNDAVAEEAEQHAEAEGKAKDHLELVERLTRDVDAAERDLQATIGGTAAIEARRGSIVADQQGKAASATKEYADQLEALRKTEADLEAQIAGGALSKGFALVEVQNQIAPLVAKIGEVNEVVERETGLLLDNEEATRLKAEADAHAAANLDLHVEGVDKLTERLAALNAVMAEENALAESNASAFATGLDALQQQEDAARRSMATAEERIALDYRAAVAAADQDRARAEAVATTAGAIETLEEQHRATLRSLDLSYYADLDKLRDDTAKKEAERLKKLEKQQQAEDAAMLSSASDLYGSVASVAAAAAESMGEEDKEAKAAAFAIQQASAMGQVALNSAIGISEAAASAPPPANIPAILAATAQGVASGIAVASVPTPSFTDTPGVQKMGTGGTVKLGADDFFAAARDPSELRRQVNEGTDPHADYRNGGPSVSIIGARAFGRRIRDDVRLRTPLSRAIFAGSGRSVGSKGRS